MALPKGKNGAPILQLDKIEPTVVEEAVSFEVSTRLLEPLAPSIPPQIFSQVGMSIQQSFYIGMAFERRGLDAEETKQLEEYYHEFIEKMREHKEEMKKMQYGEGEA